MLLGNLRLLKADLSTEWGMYDVAQLSPLRLQEATLCSPPQKHIWFCLKDTENLATVPCTGTCISGHWWLETSFYFPAWLHPWLPLPVCSTARIVITSVLLLQLCAFILSTCISFKLVLSSASRPSSFNLAWQSFHSHGRLCGPFAFPILFLINVNSKNTVYSVPVGMLSTRSNRA